MVGNRHICMLTSVHSPYDVRIFEKEARSLARIGYRVTVIGPAEADTVLDGISIYAVPRAASRAHRLNTVYRVYRRALEVKADCYHIHDPELLPVAVHLKRKTGAAVVYDVHEFLALDVSGKQWIPRWLRKLAAFLANKMERWGIARMSGIITALDERAEDLRTLNPLVSTVHNYCPSDLMNQAAPPVDVHPTLVYLGVMNRRRGLHTVIKAMEIVHRSLTDVTCYLVGDIEEIDTLSQEERSILNKHVRITGKVPYSSALGYLQAADIAWLPWTYTDYNAIGLPNKLMEYMAAGKPIIASTIGRIAEIVGSAQCGVLVDPSDPESHARAIVSLVRDQARARRYGLNARQAFLTYYNWDSEVKRLYSFYESLWESSQSKP